MSLALESAKRPSCTDVWSGIVDCAEQLQLVAGGQLPGVRELAERLGLKPTVVRDALLHAQAKGAVRIVPRVGAFLAAAPAEARQLAREAERPGSAFRVLLGREAHNILHVLDARRLIEVEMIGRVAERRRLEELLPAHEALEAMLHLPTDAPRQQYIELDFRFHAELTRPAGNDVLVALQRTFQDLVNEHFAGLPSNYEQRSLSNRFHASIYSAVAGGRADEARRAMREHLSVAYDYLLNMLEQPPAETA